VNKMTEHVITIKVDRSCSMAEVLLNGELVMMGNYWDFHPGCHGITEYGDFRGHKGLANSIAVSLQKNGDTVRIEETTYSYY